MFIHVCRASQQTLPGALSPVLCSVLLSADVGKNSPVQVLAPCALTLEGTLLGAQAFTWVGARTIAGAAGCGGVLWAAHHFSWGLSGTPLCVWHVLVHGTALQYWW